MRALDNSGGTIFVELVSWLFFFSPFFFLMCIFGRLHLCRFVCSRVYKTRFCKGGLELGQKTHWSMKLTTIPRWSNVTIMIVLLGTKLPSGCTIHSFSMLFPHATSSFHLLGCCPFLLTRKQQSCFFSNLFHYSPTYSYSLLLNQRVLIII